MSRYWHWTVVGIYLLSLPFMRRVWDLTGGKSPFLSRAVPVATGLVLLFALLWYLVRYKRESGVGVWFSLAAICVVYAFMFRALPQQIERVHLAQYALLSMLVFRAMGNGGAGYGLAVWATLVTVELGFADECFQGLIPSRIYDFNDVLLNAKAALMGQAVIVFVLRPWEKRSPLMGETNGHATCRCGALLWATLACVVLLMAFDAYILELGTPTITQDVLKSSGALAHRDGFRYFDVRVILLNAAALVAVPSVIALARRNTGECARELRTAITCGLLSPLVLLGGRLLGLCFR